jgi:O-antigen/teichoic acid export membrane protein
MFKALSKLAKHSLIYGVGHVLSRSINILLFPIHTNFIVPLELGIAANVLLLLSLITVISQLGFGESFIKHFALAKSDINKKKAFSNAFIVTFFFSAFFAIIIFAFRNTLSIGLFHSFKYNHLFFIIAGILVLDVISQTPLLALRVQERSRFIVILTLINILVNISMNIIFVIYLKKGVTGIFISQFIASAVLLLVLLPTVSRFLRLTIDFSYLRKMVLFGLPFTLPGIFKIIMDLADRYIISDLINLDTAGIYNAGYRLASIMGLIVSGFNFAWGPFFLSISEQKDAKQIFAKVMTYFLLVTSGIFIIFAFFIDYFINFKIAGYTILGHEYFGGLIVVPWIMLAHIISGINSNLVVGIFIKEKSKFMIIISGVGAVTNIIGNYIFIPIFGMVGAAAITVFSFLIMVIVHYYYLRQFYNVPYEFNRILKLIILTAIIYFIGYQSHLWQLRLGLILISPVILYFLKFFEKNELARLKQIIVNRLP